jgi:hypothetical protein
MCPSTIAATVAGVRCDLEETKGSLVSVADYPRAARKLLPRIVYDDL